MVRETRGAKDRQRNVLSVQSKETAGLTKLCDVSGVVHVFINRFCSKPAIWPKDAVANRSFGRSRAHRRLSLFHRFDLQMSLAFNFTIYPQKDEKDECFHVISRLGGSFNDLMISDGQTSSLQGS